MWLNRFLKIARFSLTAVSETFAPPHNATARDVRINGAVCILVGFLCLGTSFILALAIGSSRLTLGTLLAPALFMYASLIVGGYRLVFGVSSKASPDEILSLKRVVFGIAWMLFILGLPICALILINP